MSLSAGHPKSEETSNMLNSFLFKKINNNPKKFSSIFSSLSITSNSNTSSIKNTVSSTESIQSNSPIKLNINEQSLFSTPLPVSSPSSLFNSSFDGYSTPITPSSIVLDKSSNNGLLILSKIESLQQHPISSLDSIDSSDSLRLIKHPSVR